MSPPRRAPTDVRRPIVAEHPQVSYSLRLSAGEPAALENVRSGMTMRVRRGDEALES